MKLEYNCDNFRKNLHTFMQEDKYCDIILADSDGKTRISAHRVVLAAASSYFADKISDSDGNILKAAIDGDTLKRLVVVCYSGVLEVDENNVSSVYMGAIHLQLSALLPALENYIMTLLNDSNCLHFHKLAQTFSRSVLLEGAEKYICEHFSEICDRPSFLELDAVYLNKLLTLEELQVSSAEDLFLKVIKWIQHTSDGQRDEALVELLPNLKLSLMSPQFLMNQVHSLCKTIETKDLVMAVLSSKVETIRSIPVQVKRERLLVVAKNAGRNQEIMEYSFEQQKWNSVAVLPTAVCNFAVVYCMTWNSLCFVGGYLDGSKMNDVLLWNLQKKQFMKTVNMPTPRSRPGMISLNDGSDADGDLIVIGGYDGNNALSTVERWGCKSGKWHTLESTKERKQWTNLLRVDNFIYSIGGWDSGSNRLKTVERYNLTDGHWSTLAPLHNSRCHCGTMYDGGKVYVIGGDSDLIECYDPDKNEWTQVCTVKGGRYVETCYRYNGWIVAFGDNTVLTSGGDWKIWKESKSIPAINYVHGAFSIPT